MLFPMNVVFLYESGQYNGYLVSAVDINDPVL